MTATRGRARTALVKASGGWREPRWPERVSAPAMVAAVRSVDWQRSSWKHSLKLDRFPFVLKELFFFSWLFASNVSMETKLKWYLHIFIIILILISLC